MIQLELFYLNVKHYDLVGDFYYHSTQLDCDDKPRYMNYHCKETGHTLSDKSLERLLR